MRVRIITVRTLKEFIWRNAQSTVVLESWLRTVKKSDWRMPADILNDFPAADILGRGSERVVFDLGGNKYRMICAYRFRGKRVKLYICWIGTHAEYTRLCRNNHQFTIVDH